MTYVTPWYVDDALRADSRYEHHQVVVEDLRLYERPQLAVSRPLLFYHAVDVHGFAVHVFVDVEDEGQEHVEVLDAVLEQLVDLFLADLHYHLVSKQTVRQVVLGLLGAFFLLRVSMSRAFTFGNILIFVRAFHMLHVVLERLVHDLE